MAKRFLTFLKLSLGERCSLFGTGLLDTYQYVVSCRYDQRHQAKGNRKIGTIRRTTSHYLSKADQFMQRKIV